MIVLIALLVVVGVVGIAEKNSTLVMPFPVELLRFFEQHDGRTPRDSTRRDSEATGPAALADVLTTTALPSDMLAPATNGEDRGARGARDRLARERLDNWPTPGQVADDADARDAAPAPN